MVTHETTVYTTALVLRRVSSEGSEIRMVRPQAFDAVLNTSWLFGYHGILSHL
jgi:hypothetical protein